MANARIPLTVLTGFLGSGKTTLLNRLLADPELSDTVVIVNEFGQVPLDHLLLSHVAENIRLLDTGCLCCAVRGDLVDTLKDLSHRRASGELVFSRAIVETSGLADPMPILHSIAVEPEVARAWRLAGVATTVDAINAADTLIHHETAVHQAAVADVLVATKRDLMSGDEVQDSLNLRLAALNPYAPVIPAVDTGAMIAWVKAGASARVPANGLMHSSHASTHAGLRADGAAHHDHHHHHLQTRVRSCSLVCTSPLRESAFFEWLELLSALRGERLLRVKGLVALAEDTARPRLVHAAQHVVHPVEILEHWPSDDRSTRLVFVTQDMDLAVIQRTFVRYVGIDSRELQVLF